MHLAVVPSGLTTLCWGRGQLTQWSIGMCMCWCICWSIVLSTAAALVGVASCRTVRVIGALQLPFKVMIFISYIIYFIVPM